MIAKYIYPTVYSIDMKTKFVHHDGCNEKTLYGDYGGYCPTNCGDPSDDNPYYDV